MIAAPRISQAFLESLCPRSAFRDAVLGDLAEEFVFRAERDGLSAARRWYYRETLRATPYLLRDWVRTARTVDIGSIIVWTIGTFIIGEVLRRFLMAAGVVVAWGTVPDSFGMLYAAWRDVMLDRPTIATVVQVLAWIAPVAGGYLTALANPRAPLTTAFAVGALPAAISMIVTLWALCNAGAGELTPPSLEYRLVVPQLWLACTMTGGALRMLRTLRRSATESLH
jgi:hypothetical protein